MRSLSGDARRAIGNYSFLSDFDVTRSALAPVVACATLAVLTTGALAQTYGPAGVRQAPAQTPSQLPSIQAPSSTAVPPASPSVRSASFSQCSAAFHKALEPLRTGRGAGLGTLQRALRTTDPELPGKWQVSAPASGKAKPPPKPERVCAEMKEVPGRKASCVRWETKQPVIPPEVVAKLTPTAEEARILKPVGDFIEGKGALPDVGSNGRHGSVLARLTGEVRQYVMQEPHPSLCAGSAEVLEFYSGQAAPLKKRMDDVTALAKQAKDLSEQRVRAISITEQRAYDKAVADAARVEEQRTKLMDAYKAVLAKATEVAANAPAGTTSPSPPSEPKLPEVPTLPAKPNPPAKVEDYAVVGLPSLIAEALRPLLPSTKVTQIADGPSPVKMFVQARAALLDPETPASTAAPEVRDAALMALRMLEARVYADLYATRFKDLDATLFGSLTDLRAAQKSSCTCQEQ